MGSRAFSIYNASAGSGKTYNLAKSYIKILLKSRHQNAFKHILAITFTNKAVGEMKERIINMLKKFSSNSSLENPHPMFQDICKELDMAPKEVHIKSKSVLNQIVHNYASFDISTIDGFTHRVIRTFAFDLKLPLNFEVELDQEQLLGKAVDNLISKAGEDKELTKVLVDFAIEKADDDRSWDIGYDFKQIARLLVEENHLKHLDTLKDKSLSDFKRFKNLLASQIKDFEETIKKTSEDTIQLIEASGLEHNDFKSGWLPKFFSKLCSQDFNVNFTTGWQKDLIDRNPLYPSRVTQTLRETMTAIQPQLATYFLDVRDSIYTLQLLNAILKNVTSLSVLSAIKNELDLIKAEENVVMISEFNQLISEEIKGQPTPFIYERLGEKYKDYFIDEFQDTSKMQWGNLIPLISNKLETADGSLMLLGDAKQSIYRWRGGEAEQFMRLYETLENPFQIDPHIAPLDVNYRSRKTIVDFNNSFFAYIAKNFFDNVEYQKLYKKSNQSPYNFKEGFVSIDFLSIDNITDRNILYCEKTLNIINDCLIQNYSFGDICVLVRKKKEGVAIAEFLSSKNIPIVSSETLLIYNSEKVRFLISILKYIENPKDEISKIHSLHFMAKWFGVEDEHTFFETFMKKYPQRFFETLETFGVALTYSKIIQQPLYETVESLVRNFKLVENEDAYVQFFMDEAFSFSQKHYYGLTDFLNHCEAKKDSLSIVMPQNMDAVQIMTIHKSKGLEFPIVIFPFADLDFYRERGSKEWYQLDKNLFNGFENALINYNKDLQNFGDQGEFLYHRHQSQLKLDAINLLYVTFTRAIDQLHIVSKFDIKTNGSTNERTYSGLLIQFLRDSTLWKEGRTSYTFGEKNLCEKHTEISKIHIEGTKFISTSKESHNLNVYTQAHYLWDTELSQSIEKGNLIHLLLSKIKTADNLEKAFQDLLENGQITYQSEDQLKELVKNIIYHEDLFMYYSDAYEIYTEKDIITKRGDIIRPDRLMLKEGRAILIDYKTGNEDPSHKRQIEMYADSIKEMGYVVAEKLLLYTSDTLRIVKV